jgi:hypothetical protein
MKKLSSAAVFACVLALASPLLLAWLPQGGDAGFLASAFASISPEYAASLSASFRQLAVTLACTAAFAASIAVGLGYLSIFAPAAGRAISSVL